MQFKDIKQNYPVYILDKQEFSFMQGKVTAISFPRMEMNQKTGKTEMVVDVTVDANGKVATYVIPENLSVTCAGNIVLATEKSGLLNDVEALKNSAEQVIASVPRAEKILKSAPDLLAEINPAYREKQENEKRFSKIESSIDKLSKLMERQEQMMTNFINEFKS